MNTHTLKIVLLSLLLISAACKPVGKVDRPVAPKVSLNPADWPDCSDLKEQTKYDPFFRDEEFSARLQIAGRVSAAIEELDDVREEFLEGGVIEIFPLLLRYQLVENLKTGMSPAIERKTEFLETSLALYDSYKSNRDSYDTKDSDAIDRQWKDYFNKADELTESEDEVTPNDLADALFEGVNAHFVYDLPRAARFVIKKSDADKDVLEKDFLNADKDYARAELLLKNDVLEFFDSNEDGEEAQKVFGNGFEYVKFTRDKAWKMGAGDGLLGVLEEQPVLIHDWKSRKHFPKELKKRGICRYVE